MAKTPIVAPSANLFSHVSPTKSIHVFNDLYDKNISIIDGYSCQHGIESTVIKVTPSKLYILRNGSVSEK
jgi:L-threonylcarbamoyladenylate synthase